jgi:hypothetical protein
MNADYDKLEQHDPMPLIKVLEKVREGCSFHMYALDEKGECMESDDYVVALAFFDDYIEKIKETEEREAISSGDFSENNQEKSIDNPF